MSEEKIILEAPELWDLAWADIKLRTGTPEMQITSMPTLSEKIWGLHRKEFLVLGGRTSQGKSDLALQIASDVAKQGFQVYFLSLEMSEQAIIERLFCNLAMINNYDLFYKPNEFEKKSQEFRELIEDRKLIITYKIGARIGELYQFIEDLPKADLVILDYIQAVQGIGDKLSIVNDYILKFRQLCVDKNFAGIMVSQINRGSEMTENKRPNLWQLKSSGCILGDSLVMGKRIEDIYKNQDFFPIKTLDTDTGEVKNIIPNRIVNTGKLDCWRIKTKSGKEIILSKGTKLFSDNEWKTVDKLKISDTIVVEHSDITKEDL